MMQQTHLTAWQAHAPWPKRSQIEQDLRLSRGVAAIFGDEVLREHLAMRGGTVLHKAHLAPAARYSATPGHFLPNNRGAASNALPAQSHPLTIYDNDRYHPAAWLIPARPVPWLSADA